MGILLSNIFTVCTIAESLDRYFSNEMNIEYQKEYNFDKITRCEYEGAIHFYCPAFAMDAYPHGPYPDQKKTKTKEYTECCKDRCCTKAEKEEFTSTMRPGMCYDWLKKLKFLEKLVGCG